MALEAALKAVADRKLRRLLARNKSVNCTDVKNSDAAFPCGGLDRTSAERWRRPAKILDIDETGVTVNFHTQTSKVKRFCVRKKAEEKDVDDEECDP